MKNHQLVSGGCFIPTKSFRKHLDKTLQESPEKASEGVSYLPWESLDPPKKRGLTLYLALFFWISSPHQWLEIQKLILSVYNIFYYPSSKSKMKSPNMRISSSTRIYIYISLGQMFHHIFGPFFVVPPFWSDASFPLWGLLQWRVKLTWEPRYLGL